MKLYTDLDRIANEMKEAGYDLQTGTIPVDVVHKATMLNYSGVAGCEEVVRRAQLTSDSTVLDLGGGLGGPARVVAQLSGGKVLALEYQEELTSICNQLTLRCQMDSQVFSLHGDGCGANLCDKLERVPAGFAPKYDAVVSWLAILHIRFADRATMWANLAASLKPGAMIFVEDFYARELGCFTEEHKTLLERDVAVPEGHLPTRAEYEEQVEAAGFEGLEWKDMTSTWSEFVDTRHAAYRAAEDRHRRVHPGPTFDNMNHFYSSMSTLFRSGELRGVRLVAKRK